YGTAVKVGYGVTYGSKASPLVRPPTPEETIALGLSADDRRQLEELEKKYQIIRDYAASVARGRTTGLYVWGLGGCGQRHVIIEELTRLGVPYRLYNARLTGRGLYNALEAAPNEVHLLEDVEPLFRDSGAKGVLRSALGGQPSSTGKPPERVVTW